MCYVEIPSFGYWYWEICPYNDTVFTYTIGSPHTNIDMFLFHSGEPWAEYRKDVNRRRKPRNYGYYPVSAQYATQNGYGEANITGGECYYFVVDYTYVGAAKRDDWDRIYVWHLLTGNPVDEFGYWGEGQFAGASSLSVSGIVVCVLGLFSLLMSN